MTRVLATICPAVRCMYTQVIGQPLVRLQFVPYHAKVDQHHHQTRKKQQHVQPVPQYASTKGSVHPETRGEATFIAYRMPLVNLIMFLAFYSHKVSCSKQVPFT